MRSALATWKWASARQAPLLAAGVAFYAFTSLFPALIAAVLCYGLLATPDTVESQTEKLGSVFPDDALSVITRQLHEVTETSSNSLGVGLIIAIVIALWSASSGTGSLIKATNAMFGYTESRGFIRQKALALLLTFGAIIFLLAMLTLVAAAPAVLDFLVENTTLRALIEALRWAVLVIGILTGLNVLYRTAPDHRPESAINTRRGVFLAAVVWLLVSLIFSLYVDSFGSYAQTYGALAGVVVLLLWLWLGVLAVLLGAASARDQRITVDVRENDAVDPAADTGTDTGTGTGTSMHAHDDAGAKDHE